MVCHCRKLRICLSRRLFLMYLHYALHLHALCINLVRRQRPQLLQLLVSLVLRFLVVRRCKLLPCTSYTGRRLPTCCMLLLYLSQFWPRVTLEDRRVFNSCSESWHAFGVHASKASGHLCAPAHTLMSRVGQVSADLDVCPRSSKRMRSSEAPTQAARHAANWGRAYLFCGRLLSCILPPFPWCLPSCRHPRRQS